MFTPRMRIGVPSETFPGESRVAAAPVVVDSLRKLGAEVLVQSGAGVAAGFPDALYEQHGARIATDRAAVFGDCDVVLQVRSYGANPHNGAGDLSLLRTGQVVLAHAEPLLALDQTRAMAERGVSLLAVELVPRISRAQPMDALSSQANLAGYKAVLIAASALGKVFPMMMTAAGTVTAAKVFIVGAGVAGLQAIATAKRLGAVVSAIDVRPEVKEQVESLGARFMTPPFTATGSGGYAKEQTEEQKAAQRELMARTVAESDVVITTAAIPGKPSPVLVTQEMVSRMRPGSVIVDLAAERGGNCALTEPDRTVTKYGVTIIGTTNIPALVAHDASLTYARNLAAILKLILKDGKLTLDTADEVVAGILVTRDGQIVHPRVRELMGLGPLGEKTAEGSVAT